MTYGYLRVSKDDKELVKQKNLILEHAKNSNIIIDDFIEVQPYSKKTAKQKRIDLLMSRASKSDVLVVTELSRLGRNMLEVLNLIEALKKEDISVIFVKQPELSTTESNPLLQEILRVYGYNNVVIPQKLITSIKNVKGISKDKIENIAANFMIAQGFYETMANSLTKHEYTAMSETLDEEKTDSIVDINNNFNILLWIFIFTRWKRIYCQSL